MVFMAGNSLSKALEEMKSRKVESSRDLANWKERLTLAAFDDAARSAPKK
jgi:hypothetical protein